MPERKNSDISYQPKTQGFSYSTEKPGKKRQTVLNTFFTLIFSVLGFLFLFLVILGILNYLNIISFPSYAPFISKKLPKITPRTTPSYDSVTQTYTINGTFYGYNDLNIKVKSGNKINDFIWIRESRIFQIDSNGNFSKLFTFFDLEKPENLGKKIKAEFTVKNNENQIKTITIDK